MAKRTLFFLFLLLAVSYLPAAPVDLSTARKAGENFAQSNFASISKSADMQLVMTSSAYYVFNVGSTGFVIVSSDDAFRPIIGYSDEGVFPVDNPSPEMMYYLDNLSQGRQAALRASAQPTAEIVKEWSSLLNEKDPLPRAGKKSFYLVKTLWNQDYPYNKFCPTDSGARTYAGCVATAMSQVMNYWKHPTHGYGRHSYFHYQFGELSADFSSAEYDFDMMPISISNTSPVENIDPIALFMYHCGIAVDMGYATDGSGAYSEDVPDAVLKYFGYSKSCRLFYRDSYPLEEFQALLRDQFDLGWPCYYSGQDTGGGGGHAFVCDGYDDNDMFHFNWGWSGSGDGFFVIDGLNVSGYAFNSGQAFIGNFVPAEVFGRATKAPDGFMAMPNGDDEFTVTLTWNNPTATLEGHPIETIDVIEIQRDGEIVCLIENVSPGEAMSFVDSVGKPIAVNYSIRAIYQDVAGRKAKAYGINLGPVCDWTFKLYSENEDGWGAGTITLLNSANVSVGVVTADKGESEYQIEVPQGRVTMQWTAPVDTLEIGLEILDANNEKVFSYQGPSSNMPQGIFYEIVNTCGGQVGVNKPTELRAEIDGNDVVLHWTGIDDPGYGYVIYRDGIFYTIVDGTTFTDADMAQELHAYFVTAFCKEGETEPSNTVCAINGTDVQAPRNFDFEYLPNNKVKVKWEVPENVEGLAGFEIHRKAFGENYKRIKLLNANKTEYTDSYRFSDGCRYYYKVLAAYNEGATLSTPARSARHPELLYVEVNMTHIPSNLTLEQQDRSSLLLSWEAAFLAETYNVYRNGELVAEGVTELQYTDAVNGEPCYYQVTGVVNGVESSPSNKACYGSYAVNDIDNSNITLYPNPTKHSVTVKAENIREVVVYNPTGQQLMSRIGDGDELNMDLSKLDAGVYYFRIKTDHGSQIQKVVLVK